ncbi:MAG TPA: tetratricopeptide repeat protein [Thermoanaerobaculia bacterium]|nr:tetratricopeptide repeat protein [Thermoanaerobaculia bacterium]
MCDRPPATIANEHGLTQMMSGDLAKALASFNEALKLDATLEQARLNRGIALLRGGQIAKAIADLEPLANDEHSLVRADAAYHLALALDRLGRAPDAETWVDRAIKLDNDLDAALLFAGILRERRGDLQGAGRAYLEYLKVHPDSTVALLRFGVSAQKAGRADTARSYLRRVIALAPKSAEAVEARKYLVMWE